MRGELDHLAVARTPDDIRPAHLETLRQLWDNGTWTADAGFLAAVARRVLSEPGPCLDCGSGLSTLMLGALTRTRRDPVWSLEQDVEWSRVMGRALDAFGFDHVRLRHAPLRAWPDFVWYDVPDGWFPERFRVICCDGPAVHRAPWSPDQFTGWRAGLVDVLDRGATGFDTILLDDAEDKRAGALVARWTRAGIETEVVSTPTGPYIVGRRRSGGEAPARPA